MSAITIGQGGGGGGGGGGGTPVVPQSDDPSFGATVWLHNNTADLSTIYTPLQVYPTVGGVVDGRVTLTDGRTFQFAGGTPYTRLGQEIPMEFATSSEAADMDPVWYGNSVLKFTEAVKAKLKFCIGMSQVVTGAAVAISFHQVQSGDDDTVILRVAGAAERTLGEGMEMAPENVPDNQTRFRHIILDVPWREYGADELYYAFWDSEQATGRLSHMYCAAEYYV